MIAITGRPWNAWCTKRLFAAGLFAVVAVVVGLGARAEVIGPVWLMTAAVGVALAGAVGEVTAVRDYRAGRIDLVRPVSPSDFEIEEKRSA